MTDEKMRFDDDYSSEPCQEASGLDRIMPDSTPHASGESTANQAGSLFSPLKSPASLDDQVEKLVEHGISVADEEYAYAKDVLTQNNYYRLSGYWFLLEDENGDMPDGITLDDIVAISDFDSDLRHWLFRAIEPIEIMARTQFAYVMAMAHGPKAIEDKALFKDEKAYETSWKNICRDVEHGKRDKQPCVVHNLAKYGALPIWALVEVMTMGEISKLYGNLADEAVANEMAYAFGVKPPYLKSWLEHLTMVRNLCAHHNRVVGKLMTKRPRMYKRDKKYKNYRLFPTLLVLGNLYRSIDEDKWTSMVGELESLIDGCPQLSFEILGLPEEWKAIL